VEDRSSRADSEARRRQDLANDIEARKKAIPELRERSRQEYMKMREQQKILELEQMVMDEEILFRDVELTEQERKRHEYNKEVLRLVRAQHSISDNVEHYIIPEGVYS
jgi:pre-mRNA-splicing factor ATP-dependent RNA helicase DHX16